jgi:hypothetical protein
MPIWHLRHLDASIRRSDQFSGDDMAGIWLPNGQTKGLPQIASFSFLMRAPA